MAPRRNAVVAVRISALELVYPEAIYLHEGATCFVRELDLAQKVAYVEPREVDYYTQPHTRLARAAETLETGSAAERGAWARRRADVPWAKRVMKKIRFGLEHPITCSLPWQNLTWWRSIQLGPAPRHRGPEPALRTCAGLRNLLITILRFAVFARPDIGAIPASATGRARRYSGGRIAAARATPSAIAIVVGPGAALRLVEDRPASWVVLPRGLSVPFRRACRGPRFGTAAFRACCGCQRGASEVDLAISQLRKVAPPPHPRGGARQARPVWLRARLRRWTPGARVLLRASRTSSPRIVWRGGTAARPNPRDPELERAPRAA
jgi:hypothetical protein